MPHSAKEHPFSRRKSGWLWGERLFQSRFQAGLLLKSNPSAPEIDSKLFIEEIWPVVQAANQTTAAHGRVMKNKIGLASQSKLFKRALKGMTQRCAFIWDYKEIDALYAADMEDNSTYSSHRPWTRRASWSIDAKLSLMSWRMRRLRTSTA